MQQTWELFLMKISCKLLTERGERSVIDNLQNRLKIGAATTVPADIAGRQLTLHNNHPCGAMYR